MKTKDLDAILDNAEMSNAEKRAAIMALNGQDVNAAKDKYAGEIESKGKEYDALKGSYDELSKKMTGYADYEDLKKYKADNEAKLVSGKRQAYLKKIGFEKGADLIESKIDWEKAQYDEDKQEFTGIDVDSLKTQYDYLLATPNPQPQNVKQNHFNAGGNGKGATDTKANNFLSEFYKLNPGLKPKEE